MRALLVGALATTLVGCGCLSPPRAAMKSCTDGNGFACFDRTAASWPIEPEPASFETDSETTEIKSTIAAKTEKPSSAHARDRAHLATKTAKPTMIAAKVEPPSSRIPLPPRSLKTRLQLASNAAADSDTTRANIADSHPTGGAVANSNTSTIQEQVAAAMAIAERMTVGAVVPAPEPKANNKDRSNHSETVLRGDAEKTAPASPNEPPTGNAQNQPADTVWVVSETTSPVDYSPLITAVIHSTSSVKGAPNTLAVRCRGLRTELLLRMEGTWPASRASEVQVDYQINDQSFVRLQWTVSADGKTASYKDDAVGLLRSLPEGARLKISVFDGRGPGQEATFQLTGLDSVRKKIGLACKWPPTADKMSSGKR
jgi:Type VI secretion system VasI, EvfG, VC_A0118